MCVCVCLCVRAARQKEMAELMGKKWVDDDELDETDAAKAAPQVTRAEGMPAPGAVEQVHSEAAFNNIVAAAGETPTIVKFFAPWCRKCAALKPKFANLARGYGERVIFIKMDVENREVKAMIKAKGVKSIPTFQLWKNGEMVDQYAAGDAWERVLGRVAEGLGWVREGCLLWVVCGLCERQRREAGQGGEMVWLTGGV